MSDTEQNIDATSERSDGQQRAEQVLHFAEQLVEQAKDQRLDLVGPDGVLTGLTKRVNRPGIVGHSGVGGRLEAKLTEHLGYDKHAVEGRDGGNFRNGTRPKTVVSEIGPVELDVPRDRGSSFEPQLVKKRQRRLHVVDEMVISLTAKGLATGEVQAHLAEVYGIDVSRETVSKITHAIFEEMTDWRNRPLEQVYAAVFIDAIVVKIRDGQVTNRPADSRDRGHRRRHP